ncbi:MAG: serine hydrolase domain-containing protein [Planctomycetota bacterium]
MSPLLKAGTILVLAAVVGSVSARETRQVTELREALEAIRAQHDLPALAGAIVGPRGLETVATVGVRKADDPEAPPATDDDLWHLGSCGKAMTATMIARLVEAGTLRFEQTLGESFPEQADEMPETLRGITLEQLLTHRSGLPANFNQWAFATDADRTHPNDARRKVLRATLDVELLHDPGSAFVYSNWGYVLAGHIAESNDPQGRPYERLMREEVFEPLGIKTAGFRGTGTIGQIDQPWPHEAGGAPAPSNGPEVDNSPVMAPAGTMHMTLADWSRFVADHLNGHFARGELLKQSTYRRLHTPVGDDQAMGWISVERGWAGVGDNNRALTHSGDNTMNRAVVWAAPERRFAVLVVTNRSGTHAACDAAAWRLIQTKLNR